jgi:hypothetical protein
MIQIKMDDTLKAAAGTGMMLGLFKTRKSALRNLKTAKTRKLPISLFKSGKVDNLNPQRLSKNPYPKSDRPRGSENLMSVKFHRRTIRKTGQITKPVWLYHDKNKYVMLDGVHRVVATYLEKKRFIPARVFTRKVPKKT